MKRLTPTLFITITLLLVACGKETSDEQGQSELIRIHPAIEASAKNRASDQWSLDGAAGTSRLLEFGVYAYYKGNPYMNGTTVKRDDEMSEWVYKPEMFWPAEGTIDFYAYAPLTLPTGGTLTPKGDMSLSSDIPSNPPTITYTVDASPAHQADLLLAVPQKDRTRQQGTVKMPFRHALTKITFSARVDKITAGKDIKIEKIELTNAYHKGTHSIDATSPWTVDQTTPKSTYTLTKGVSLFDLPLTEQYTQLSTPQGVLMLLPQTINETMTVEVTYSVYSGTVAEPSETLSLPLHLAHDVWKQGVAINYTILIGNGPPILVIEVSVEDWKFVNRVVELG